MAIYREFKDKIVSFFSLNRPSASPRGLILSGIVGSGKTTLIEMALSELQSKYKVYRYTGDDVIFRNSVASDSKFLMEDLDSRSSLPPLIFVDEVQKSDAIFDALKFAFDHGKASFVVSGSNPEYLATVARRRLQRRADQWILLPISLKELLVDQGAVSKELSGRFEHLLFQEVPQGSPGHIPDLEVPFGMQKIVDQYLEFGGLPLTLLASTPEEKLREIRLVCERGFDLISNEDHSLSDFLRTELARLNSREFTYKNVMEKTRVRRRDKINSVIDQLLNHGYLVKKRPVLLGPGKTSYLSVYSYIDPGISRYLIGESISSSEKGFQLEAYVHSRLHTMVQNSPFKAALGYFKPYKMDPEGHARYQPGEIDFVLQVGPISVPIEVKLQNLWSDIDTSLLQSFLREQSQSMGVVIYGGRPKLDSQKKILFWPYWLV